MLSLETDTNISIINLHIQYAHRDIILALVPWKWLDYLVFDSWFIAQLSESATRCPTNRIAPNWNHQVKGV